MTMKWGKESYVIIKLDREKESINWKNKPKWSKGKNKAKMMKIKKMKKNNKRTLMIARMNLKMKTKNLISQLLKMTIKTSKESEKYASTTKKFKSTLKERVI